MAIAQRRENRVWQVRRAFGGTEKKLHAATESIENASRKTRTIERKLRRVEALDEGKAARLLSGEGASRPLQMVSGTRFDLRRRQLNGKKRDSGILLRQKAENVP
jgi:DNA anti-recombination protein RmuC